MPDSTSPDSGRLLYFAYGSNLLRARLEQRVGRVEVHGCARIPGWRLAFNKRSRDGSGKGNLVADPAAVLWGAVYGLDPAALTRLDVHEELGTGYERIRLTAETAAGSLPVVTYRALTVDDALLPYDWYLQLVRRGSEEHALPMDCRTVLDGWATRPDPDPERAARYTHLLDQVKP